MTNLSLAIEKELQTFLCEHFDLLELTHLARGVLAEDPTLIHLLPLESPASALALSVAFINVLKRHGFLDDEFFRALCAAKPRLRDKITHLWEEAKRDRCTTPVKRKATNRIRICLDVEFENLSSVSLTKILVSLYAIAEISRIVLESVTRGSSILVLRGSPADTERVIQRVQPQSQLAGFRVSGIERVDSLPRTTSSSPYAPLGELDLLARWRGGDALAGRELFERGYDGLYRFFAGKVVVDIEELLEQTLLACVEGRARIVSFRAYLFGTARYMLFKYYREHARENFDEVETSLEDLVPSPSRLVDATDGTRLIIKALRRLPLDLQVLLELRYWEHLSFDELAEATRLSRDTVRARIERATTLLRRNLHALAPERDIDPAAIDLRRFFTIWKVIFDS